jgi:hypothetical protein
MTSDTNMVERVELVARVSQLLGSREPLPEVREIVGWYTEAGYKLTLMNDERLAGKCRDALRIGAGGLHGR